MESRSIRYFRQLKLQTETSDFLDGLSLSFGFDGLFQASLKARELAQAEPDLKVAGALVLLHLALIAIAHDLESSPTAEHGEARRHQIDALLNFVRDRDAASLARLSSFRAL